MLCCTCVPHGTLLYCLQMHTKTLFRSFKMPLIIDHPIVAAARAKYDAACAKAKEAYYQPSKEFYDACVAERVTARLEFEKACEENKSYVSQGV